MALLLKIAYIIIGLRTDRFQPQDHEAAYWEHLYVQLNGPGICGTKFEDFTAMQFVVIFFVNTLNYLGGEATNWQLVPFPCF